MSLATSDYLCYLYTNTQAMFFQDHFETAVTVEGGGICQLRDYKTAGCYVLQKIKHWQPSVLKSVQQSVCVEATSSQ